MAFPKKKEKKAESKVLRWFREEREREYLMSQPGFKELKIKKEEKLAALSAVKKELGLEDKQDEAPV